jgi:GNAT superfamily N-acetyltransferase
LASIGRPGGEIVVREVGASDTRRWEQLRCELWPGSDGDHAAESAAFFDGTLAEPQAVLLAYRGLHTAGFAELSIREDVAGLVGKRAGYVEGLYVEPSSRAQGVARKLLRALKSWAKTNGCQGFASDRAGRIVIDRGFRAAVKDRSL